MALTGDDGTAERSGPASGRQEDGTEQGGAVPGGPRRLARVLALPARYPLTLLWAVLMLVTRSGVLAHTPAPVAAIVYAIAAPIMIPAYVVGLAWLSLGAALRIAELVPRLFEVVGVLVVAAGYVAIDRWLRSLRAAVGAARSRH